MSIENRELIDTSILELIKNTKTEDFYNLFIDAISYGGITNKSNDYPMLLLSEHEERSYIDMVDEIINYYYQELLKEYKTLGFTLIEDVTWEQLKELGFGIYSLNEEHNEEVEDIRMSDLSLHEKVCSILDIANPEYEVEDYMEFIEDVTKEIYESLLDKIVIEDVVIEDEDLLLSIEEDQNKEAKLRFVKTFCNFVRDDSLVSIKLIRESNLKFYLTIDTYLTIYKPLCNMEEDSVSNYNRIAADLIILSAYSSDVALGNIPVKVSEILSNLFDANRYPAANHASVAVYKAYNDYIKGLN